MVIDFHTHCFPDAIAQRVLETLSRNAGNVVPYNDGTLAGLHRSMSENNIDISVVLNIATNEKQQKNVNNFAARSKGPGIVPFGSVYPGAPDALDELERVRELGLPGIKLHPEYQDFFVDDEKLFPLYAKAAALGLITVFHAGRDVAYDEPVRCSPERLARALPVFGGAPVVAAHMGGYLMWDEVERHLVGRPVYLDTSFCQFRIPVPQAARVVRRHGADRILFGSDMPWSDADREVRFISGLGLSPAEEEKIRSGNAQKLLGLP